MLEPDAEAPSNLSIVFGDVQGAVGTGKHALYSQGKPAGLYRDAVSLAEAVLTAAAELALADEESTALHLHARTVEVGVGVVLVDLALASDLSRLESRLRAGGMEASASTRTASVSGDGSCWLPDIGPLQAGERVVRLGQKELLGLVVRGATPSTEADRIAALAPMARLSDGSLPTSRLESLLPLASLVQPVEPGSGDLMGLLRQIKGI